MARRALVLILAVVLAIPLAASALSLPDFPDDPLPGASTSDPSVVGRWSDPFDGQVPAISMVLLDDGRILYWGGVEAEAHDQVFFFGAPHVADVAIIAPPYTAADVTYLPNPEGMGDLFCAGLAILADGTVLVAGGSDWLTLGEEMSGFVDGVSDAWIFDPDTTSWIRADEMNAERWYPTVMTRADGSGFALSGIQHLPQPHTLEDMVEGYAEGAWTPLDGAENLLPMYPRIFTIPSGALKGDLFYETSATLWGPFGEHPLEPMWNLEQVLDTQTNTWSVVGPSVFGARQHAFTVMLPLSADDGYTARILTAGGSIGRSVAATNLAEITTINADGTVSHEVADALDHPRWHANGVLLPDGSVLAVGGGMSDNVYAHGQRTPEVLVAEKFDPASGEWAQMAPMSVGRTYHSTAILLPDGRVMAGGHVPLPVPWTAVRDNVPYQSQIAETRFEIFEPPYLHWGVLRPEITTAPASIGYGETFTVGTPDGHRIRDAILVHPGATTHAWDVNERAIVLPVVEADSGSVTFVAPPDGDVAMPGPWMIFLRVQAEEGIVPGPAKFVSLG